MLQPMRKHGKAAGAWPLLSDAGLLYNHVCTGAPQWLAKTFSDLHCRLSLLFLIILLFLFQCQTCMVLQSLSQCTPISFPLSLQIFSQRNSILVSASCRIWADTIPLIMMLILIHVTHNIKKSSGRIRCKLALGPNLDWLTWRYCGRFTL